MFLWRHDVLLFKMASVAHLTSGAYRVFHQVVTISELTTILKHPVGCFCLPFRKRKDAATTISKRTSTYSTYGDIFMNTIFKEMFLKKATILIDFVYKTG